MIRVKICGITNLADAQLAVELGADELGFNFYHGSSRFVPSKTCKIIVADLPESVGKVGVFVNENIDNICRISETVGLNAIQLHGNESPEFVNELRQRSNCRLIKAIRVEANFGPAIVQNYRSDSILLDAPSNGQYGGTGRTFDWSLAKLVNPSVRDLYLAGGLTPENVAAAIRMVDPNTVDTASGVEASPGKKDPEKLRLFIAAAKSV